MGTTVLMDTGISGVRVEVDLSGLEIEGAYHTDGTSHVDIDFAGASIPRRLTVRFEPSDTQVKWALRAWDASGDLPYGTLTEAIEQDRLGKGDVVFGLLDLPPVHVDKR